MGAACSRATADDFETLLRKADMAMYTAKERGRNALAYYDSAMSDRRCATRTELEDELRHAWSARVRGATTSPHRRARSRRIVGAEALVRWRHPTRG
jgi:predicted signal transduction protein with EAL and GGDEF domain